ncbi:potassium-transporting ATPase subunit KdpA [Lactococcus lactis]|jgi:K+-transporting ATPase ATPase A chain|uniref:Potassium-transporting ATPase potassium-binding subunit n=3 Tax=Lactococcus lactis TaxID=1358 RepID=A0AAP5UD43_9LACT|nr:potassium-transporting ATPase subunit KdpA [Lactococcus lactis]MDT2859944.1 potassium-transporting ATPase subunit KdpA [Lactococcus lactis]MDT2863191.1 potassium-transporting ATPase subunit KdpA [Lactococcus lactis]MDT2868628.1 potassium-transporting ATPase subunit KdpA [Lactococcus lactis]MDT2869551.1 potassium-transporting ATPase subunit KdpA [Lactococcus lactis]MDT2873147.1 potassium-transporting ATPase subunit KdpA [Lactococcus lactis]
MLQIIFVLAVAILLMIPTGKYLYHIATDQKTFADPVMDKFDGFIYKLIAMKKQPMTWKKYALSLVLTNSVMVFIGYLILRIQEIPFLNPNHIGAMEQSLSFNTVISFITNTNLQNYSGESALSYMSQMIVITFMMFTSAASGFAASMAFIRGLSGKYKDMGNFYYDFVRVITRVLLPFSIIGALLLISQGVPQTLVHNLTITTLEGKMQDIALGPVAALEIIKHLGTNGGGFFAANSAMPFENPNIITNIIEMLSMMLLPGSILFAFGYMVSDSHQENKLLNSKLKSKRRLFLGKEARPLFIVMSVLFLIGLTIIIWAESKGNPILQHLGLSQTMGNMEGKETRFGTNMSALFTEITTAFTTGSVNNMHDSLTPLGGGIAMINMMLNLVFGGKGVGLMNMILYVLLTVFICGLMIGRTPVYLGKKIEGKEMKLTALAIIIHPLIILSFTALAVSVSAGIAGVSNPGFHGLSQIVYQYTSSAANNGSGFEGLKDNTAFWNITTGVAIFLGRYLTLIIQLAIASSLMMKRSVNNSVGSLKTDSGTFTVVLFVIVIVISALTFLPVLVLGPIAESLTL